MAYIGLTLVWAIWVYTLVLIGRVIIGWVQFLARDWHPQGMVAVLLEILYSATDPPIKAIRRVVPPVRLGAVMMDFSPVIVLIGLVALRWLVILVFLT